MGRINITVQSRIEFPDGDETVQDRIAQLTDAMPVMAGSIGGAVQNLFMNGSEEPGPEPENPPDPEPTPDTPLDTEAR